MNRFVIVVVVTGQVVVRTVLVVSRVTSVLTVCLVVLACVRTREMMLLKLP